MADELRGRTVAVLAADGVERVELEAPRGALYRAGARTELLSLHDGEIAARQMDLDPAGTFPVDRQVADASVEDYDALLLPGGTMNPDQLRTVSHDLSLEQAPEAYKHFDAREDGWTKVVLHPGQDSSGDAGARGAGEDR